MKHYQGQNLNAVFKHNREVALEIISRYGPISKPQLASMMGLSVPSINNIVRELSGLNLVTERGLGESDCGRPPVLYDIDPDVASVLSVDLSGAEIRIALVNLKGEIVDKSGFRIDETTNTMVYSLIKTLDKVLKSSAAKQSNITGISLAVPGLVDIEKGVVNLSVPLGWRNVSLKEIIEETFSYHTIVGKETHAAIQAQYFLQEELVGKDSIYVYLGTGIGIGIVINDRIFQGTKGMSGEMGHTVVEFGGPLCDCGQRGCLERVASPRALVKYMTEYLVQDCQPSTSAPQMIDQFSVGEVFKLAQEGHKAAVNSVDKVAAYLAVSIGNLDRLFDPEIIFLGGSLGPGGDILYKAVFRQCEAIQSLFGGGMLSRKIAVDLSQDTVLLGAGYWSIRNVFRSVLEREPDGANSSVG